MCYVQGVHTDAPTQLNHMTDAQRAEALAELATRLAELTTPAERDCYPFTELLLDLINDLEG